MAFDAAGNLLESDDGGVYRRANPQLTTGVWSGVDGNITTTEAHSASYDPVNQRFISGNQDTGTSMQTAVGGASWNDV